MTQISMLKLTQISTSICVPTAEPIIIYMVFCNRKHTCVQLLTVRQKLYTSSVTINTTIQLLVTRNTLPGLTGFLDRFRGDGFLDCSVRLPPRHLQTFVAPIHCKVQAILHVLGGSTRYYAGVPVFLALYCISNNSMRQCFKMSIMQSLYTK